MVLKFSQFWLIFGRVSSSFYDKFSKTETTTVYHPIRSLLPAKDNSFLLRCFNTCSLERSFYIYFLSQKYCLHSSRQCCGSGSGIGCLFDPWIRDGRKSASGSGIRDEQPGSYFLELRNHFFAFLGVKILKFFDEDPGSGMETVRIRDPDPGWKKVGSRIRDKHPGSATLVPGKLCGVKKRVLPRSLLQQLIVASGPGAEEDMTALLELLHSTGHTNLALRDGPNLSVDEQISLSKFLSYD